ncbi:MAG: hypothetical protein COB37_09540 [Kordiimonadales bacterium]|nr:MAG: hypothetical protein COB37_09540 [Kordiimonadales bacterium]
MPQFDKVTFNSQIVWLLITFFSLYYFFLIYSPVLFSLLKMRKKRLNFYLFTFSLQKNLSDPIILTICTVLKNMFILFKIGVINYYVFFNQYLANKLVAIFRIPNQIILNYYNEIFSVVQIQFKKYL